MQYPIIREDTGHGKTLGFYHQVAAYLIIIPVSLLLVITVIYNVLVGISTWWMYKHAALRPDGRPKAEVKVADLEMAAEELQEDPAAKTGLPDHLHTSFWEDIFVSNINIASFLLGGIMKIKNMSDGIVIKIHDYAVFMPLAIVFIQASEIAICVVTLVIFMEYMFIETSNTCDPDRQHYFDCFDVHEYNLSSTPIDCKKVKNAINVTCLHITFNPIIASGIAGGFLKIIPKVLIGLSTYFYLKLYKTICNQMPDTELNKTTAKIITAVVTELILVGGGSTIFFVLPRIDQFNSPLSFSTVNPVMKIRNVSLTLAFFLVASLLWCIYPQSKAPIRYYKSLWKKNVTKLKTIDEMRRKSRVLDKKMMKRKQSEDAAKQQLLDDY